MLVAIAKNADDQGVTWRGIATIGKNTRMSERNTMRVVDRLEREFITKERDAHRADRDRHAVQSVELMRERDEARADAEADVESRQYWSGRSVELTARIAELEAQVVELMRQRKKLQLHSQSLHGQLCASRERADRLESERAIAGC